MVAMPRKQPSPPPPVNASEQPNTSLTGTPLTATTTQTPQAPVGGTKVLPSPGTKVKTEVRQTYEETAGPSATAAAVSQADRFAGQRPDLHSQFATGAGTFIVDFLDDYKDEPGLTMLVVREADPIQKRVAGNTFRRRCDTPETLGFAPFNPDPAMFIQDLRTLNGNSGGVFTVQLYDIDSDPIPGGTFRGYTLGDSFDAPAPATNGNKERGPKTLLEQLKEQNDLKAEIERFTGVSSEGHQTKDGAMFEMLKDSGVIAGTVGALTTTITQAVQAANDAASRNSGTEPQSTKDMVVRHILDNEGVQNRMLGAVDRTIDILGGVVASWFGSKPVDKPATRPDGLPPQQTESAAEPELEEAPLPAAKPPSEGEADILTFMIAQCTVNAPVHVYEDKFILEFKRIAPADYYKFVGGLKLLSLDGFKKAILKIADADGRGEQLRTALALPHADNFIAYMQQTAKG